MQKCEKKYERKVWHKKKHEINVKEEGKKNMKMY